jgi:aspartate racemase
MKTIGLIGGMSWESTVTYYQVINERIKKELGGLHSAKILLYSVDFSEIEQSMKENDWEDIAERMIKAAVTLEKAGADFILICTNTIHKVVPQMKSHISVPLIHIAETAAETLKERGFEKAALLGTRFTMNQDFYKEKLREGGISVIIPEVKDAEEIDRIIFQELCLGIVTEESRQKYLDIIERLAQKGAQAVILGCTEIGMLISQKDTNVPVFDTTVLHAEKAAGLAIED